MTPQEVEEVCFEGRPRVLRTKSQGEHPAYYVQGQTRAGRHLFCVVLAFPDGNGFPVTARDMTEREKRAYRQWKNR